MNITNSDLIVLAHAAFGVLGILVALWVYVEALHARQENAVRMRYASLAVAFCMTAAWLLGGYWYVHFYPVDKALILKGPWPFAHNLFMETKEHFVFCHAYSFLLSSQLRPGRIPIQTGLRARWCSLSPC